MRGVAMVVAVIMALGGMGCSSAQRHEPVHVVDLDKVGLVNAAARDRGVEVIWINPPKKLSDSARKPISSTDR